MKIYKTKVEYKQINEIHIQSANKREKNGRLLKVICDGEKVGYLDIYEANVILAQQIELLNDKKILG